MPALFTLLPLQVFLAMAIAGLATGIALRLVLFARAARRASQPLRKDQWVEHTLAAATQSLAVGFPLTFLTAILLATQTRSPLLLALATGLTAFLGSFLAAYVRTLLRRAFYASPDAGDG